MLQRLARKLSNWKYLALAGAIQAAPACTAMTETDDFPESEWKVPETTKVLSAEDLEEQQLQTGEYGRIVYFDRSSAFARDLSRGDIIIAGTSPQFPDGLLRRVTEIAQGDYTIATTEQATLEEAIEQGRFDARLNLADAYQQAETRGDDLETRTQNLRIEATGGDGLRIVFTRYEITPGITIGGEVLLEPRINVMADIGLFTLREAAVSVEGLEDLTIEVETAYRAGIKRDSPQQTLARLKPLTFMTPAGIPLVVTPVLSIGYGTEAEAEFSIKGTLHQRINAEIGLSYKKAREPAWEPIARFDHTFEFLYPEQPTLHGKVESYAKPRLSFLLYGVVGPNVSLKGALGAEANLEEIAFYTTLGVNLGIEVKALSATLADYEVEVYSARRDLKKIELGGGPGGDQCNGRTNRCSADKRQVEVYDGCNKLVDRVECRSIGENYQCEGGECLEQLVEEPAEGEGEDECAGIHSLCSADRQRVERRDNCDQLVSTINCRDQGVDYTCINGNCAREEQPAEGEGEPAEGEGEVLPDWIFVRKIQIRHIVNGREYRLSGPPIHSMASDDQSFWYVAVRHNRNSVDLCTLDLEEGITEQCVGGNVSEFGTGRVSLGWANGQMYFFDQGDAAYRFSTINLQDGSKQILGRFPFREEYRLRSISSYDNSLFMYKSLTGNQVGAQFCMIELPTALLCGDSRGNRNNISHVAQIAEQEYLLLNGLTPTFAAIHGDFFDGGEEEIERLGVAERCGGGDHGFGTTLIKVDNKVYIACASTEFVGGDVGNRANILEYQRR